MAQSKDTIPSLDDKGIKRFQVVIGALLYVEIAFNNKLIVALSAIGSQKAAPTLETEESIEQLLDYFATYPDDGILFRERDMILAAQADTGFIN